jgi:hypothetical protein
VIIKVAHPPTDNDDTDDDDTDDDDVAAIDAFISIFFIYKQFLV